MKRFAILLGCLLLFNIGLFSQEADLYNIEVAPNSPTVAALEKFISYPVGLYTGATSISIPLWTATNGSLSVPITIGYHASGIKVDQVSSWVGLGWSLSAGGQISRQLRGNADEEAIGGFFNSFSTINDVENGNYGDPYDTDLYSKMENLSRGTTVETKPDIFSLMAPGVNGKFFFGRDGNIHMLDYKSVTIDEELSSSGTDEFTVTSQNGTKYYFSTFEEVITIGNGTRSDFQSAWLLDKMVSADLVNSIYFFYEDDHIQNDILRSQPASCLYSVFTTNSNNDCSEITSISAHQTGYINNCTYNSVPFNVQQKHFNKKLKSIKAGNYIIKFIGSYDKDDVNGITPGEGGDGLRLEDIKILYLKDGLDETLPNLESSIDNLNESSAGVSLVKQFSFEYETITATGGTSYGDKRMYLTSLIEGTGSETKEHEFIYKQQSILPSRNSNDYDHWGYFNDADNPNESSGANAVKLFPTQYVGMNDYHLEGANRWVNTVVEQAGMLETITFPTGGATKIYL